MTFGSPRVVGVIFGDSSGASDAGSCIIFVFCICFSTCFRCSFSGNFLFFIAEKGIYITMDLNGLVPLLQDTETFLFDLKVSFINQYVVPQVSVPSDFCN